MSVVIRPKRYTFEEFCDLIAEDQKADLIDGEILMASPENTDANDIGLWIGNVMYDFAEQTDAGKVHGSRVACRLDEWNGPEPDLFFVRKSRRQLILRRGVDGNPDLAMEIVSPESVERDYLKKLRQYEQARVPEYWIVDEVKRKLTVYRLDPMGKYRKANAVKGVMRSRVFKGFWLRLEWLWPETRPTALSALLQLLKAAKREPR